MRTVEELEALLEVTTRERDEAKAHVVCLEALLRERTEECDELDEERREAWQHVQNNMSHVLLKRAHGALADAGDVEVPPLTEPIDEVIRAIAHQRDEARAEVQHLTDERDELLVRVANQDAELRATREAYVDAYRRGVEAMRESWCRTRALPIPEEP
jgi:hypothetical protein